MCSNSLFLQLVSAELVQSNPTDIQRAANEFIDHQSADATATDSDAIMRIPDIPLENRD